MSEPLSPSGRSPERLAVADDSVVARLVNATLAHFGQLRPSNGTGASAIVGVVRGFDQASRTRAHLVRQGLDDYGVLSADVLAVPASMRRSDALREAETLGAHLAEPADELQLLVDASATGGGEAERLAARLGVPLVMAAGQLLTDGALALTRSGAVAVMALQLSTNDIPSSGAPLCPDDVALRNMVLSPVYADLSQLQLTTEPHRHVVTVPGATVTLTVGPESIHVQATDPDGTTQRWRQEQVELRPLGGRYTVIRDDMPTLDLAAGRLTVTYRRDGLIRLVA